MLHIAMCLAMSPSLGAFAKLRKVIISFVMSVRLSVFLEYVEKIQVSLKSDKNTGYF
jgi:hypothetical protein